MYTALKEVEQTDTKSFKEYTAVAKLIEDIEDELRKGIGDSVKLKKKRSEALSYKNSIDKYLANCPYRIQLIIKYKYIEGLSWEDTGRKLGRSHNSARKELERYMKIAT